MLLCGYSNSNWFIKGCPSLCTNQAVTRAHMMSLFYLHVCYLVLFPVKALHLVLFQLLSGLHILVIVTLIMKIDLHCHPTGWHTDTYLVTACLWFPYSALCDYIYSNLFMILGSLKSMLRVFSFLAVTSASCPYRVVLQFLLMQVDDIGTHTVQEVLRVWDEHEDSLKPDKNHQVDQNES